MQRSNEMDSMNAMRRVRTERFGAELLGGNVRKPVAMFVLLTALGCGSAERHAVNGAVTVGGQPVEVGRVFFVPVEGAKGPRVSGEIISGQYRIEADGGLEPGKYRVELDAKKKTGRKVQGRVMGGETAQVDETIPIAPPLYRDANSPLVVEVPGADGVINIEVPAA